MLKEENESKRKRLECGSKFVITKFLVSAIISGERIRFGSIIGPQKSMPDFMLFFSRSVSSTTEVREQYRQKDEAVSHTWR